MICGGIIKFKRAIPSHPDRDWETYLNPDYGSNFKQFVFEQVNAGTYQNIEQLIKDDLALYFPQVELKSLEVTGDPDELQINIGMTYAIFNNEEDTLEINLNA